MKQFNVIHLGMILLLLAVLAVIIFWIKSQGYFITYQVTPSMQQGFYLVKPLNGKIKRGEIVIFTPPPKTLNFLQNHHWLPNDDLMLKHVFGIPGDKVWQKSGFVWINNTKIAPVYKFYAKGKLLPNSNFCGVLDNSEYLLMSTKIKRSFDGRYFGPVNRKKIIGRAIFLF